jgi:hypothetical protein
MFRRKYTGDTLDGEREVVREHCFQSLDDTLDGEREVVREHCFQSLDEFQLCSGASGVSGVSGASGGLGYTEEGVWLLRHWPF